MERKPPCLVFTILSQNGTPFNGFPRRFFPLYRTSCNLRTQFMGKTLRLRAAPCAQDDNWAAAAGGRVMPPPSPLSKKKGPVAACSRPLQRVKNFAYNMISPDPSCARRSGHRRRLPCSRASSPSAWPDRGPPASGSSGEPSRSARRRRCTCSDWRPHR